MPNHISNIVSLRKPDENEGDYETMKQLGVMMKTDESIFDFNVLIPYPQHFAELDNVAYAACAAGVSWKEAPKDGYNQGGYQWCVTNWGTKWNAYDVTFEWGELSFQTAWATPLPIWIELSKRFPDFILHIEYADEDIGSNCGILDYQSGKLIHSESEKTLHAPSLFARATIGDQRSAYYYTQCRNLEDKLRAIQNQPFNESK